MCVQREGRVDGLWMLHILPQYKLPGKPIPYGDRRATRPASRTRSRRHTSHPRNRTGGRCWRSFLARHHRRALCVIPATSHRTNRASSSNVLGQKCIIRYRSFGRPSKGGAVCRGDDPDVWRERRKRINAGADPLSRNSYARPSRRYMRRIFLAFFCLLFGRARWQFYCAFPRGRARKDRLAVVRPAVPLLPSANLPHFCCRLVDWPSFFFAEGELARTRHHRFDASASLGPLSGLSRILC